MIASLARETFWDAYKTESQLEQKHIRSYMDTAFSDDAIRRNLADEKKIYLVAEDEASELGYAKLANGSTRKEIHKKHAVELCRIYLKKKSWGKSIGSILLRKCVEEAEKRDAEVMWLSVWEHNQRAIQFYERHGFEIVGSHIFDLASSLQTDFIMTRNLS